MQHVCLPQTPFGKKRLIYTKHTLRYFCLRPPPLSPCLFPPVWNKKYKRWLSRQLGREGGSVNHIKESVSGTLRKICAGQGGIEWEAPVCWCVCVCVGQRHEWMPSYEHAASLTRLLRQLVCRQQRGCLQHAFAIQQTREASNPSVFMCPLG